MTDAPPPRFGVLRLLVRSATGWLIVVNIAIFVALYFGLGAEASGYASVLAACGAKWNPGLARGEWWRLVSCTFLHGGWWHLLLNMWALLNLGLVLEVIVGTRLFLFIYAVSGLAGSAVSYLGNTMLSIGASGAIFGIGGALLALGYIAPERVPPALRKQVGRGALPFIVINIFVGLGVNAKGWLGIDNHAHIGGLIGGAVVTTAIALLARRPDALSRVAPVVALLALALEVAGIGFAARHLPEAVRMAEVTELQEQYFRPLVEAYHKAPGNEKAFLEVARDVAGQPPVRPATHDPELAAALDRFRAARGDAALAKAVEQLGRIFHDRLRDFYEPQ